MNIIMFIERTVTLYFRSSASASRLREGRRNAPGWIWPDALSLALARNRTLTGERFGSARPRKNREGEGEREPHRADGPDGLSWMDWTIDVVGIADQWRWCVTSARKDR